jgi:hypothetical protein
MRSGFDTVRDLVLFILGVAVLLYALIYRDPPPDAVTVGVGILLVGLPIAALFPGGPRGK